MIRQIVSNVAKPMISAAIGVVMTNLVEIDSFSALIGVTEENKFIKDLIIYIGSAFFFWKAYMIATKTIKEKQLANESTKIKNDSDAYDLEKKREDDKNKGLIKEIEEIKETQDEILQILKDQNV